MKVKNIFEQAIDLMNVKDYTLAIVKFTESLEKNNYESIIHYYLAICYSNLKYYKEALEEIELSFKEDLKLNVKIHLYLLKAYILFTTEEKEEALKAFEEANKLDEINLVALSGIGYCYYENKEYDKALKYFKKAIEINPNNANALNSYGYTLMISKDNIKEAIKYCEKAYSINPENPAILDSVGWGYYMLENIKKSVLYLSKAFKLKSAHNTIKNHYEVVSDKVRDFLKK